MEAKIFFSIYYGYDQTLNKPLKDLAINTVWDIDQKKYCYHFRLEDLYKVLSLIAKPITFEGSAEDIKKLIGLCAPLEKQVKVNPYKGEGYVNIVRKIDDFIVEFPMNKTPKKTVVPVEMINSLWAVILNYPLNKAVKTRTVARNFCKMNNITRFDRENQTFDWQKYSGSRKSYLKFWAALKVLQHYEVINYHRHGTVERIKDKLELQTEIG